MPLIKGPFVVKVDDYILNNVSEIIYDDKKLTVDVLISDLDMANRLLTNPPISRVFCIGCGFMNIGAIYSTKKLKTSILIQDRAVMVLRLTFDVWRAKVGVVSE